MNALSRIHAALRPHGLLLNLLPDAAHRAIEVEIGGAILQLGRLDETRNIQDFQAMLAVQQAAIDGQQFILERETYFTFIDHFDTVDNWLTYMEQEHGAIVPAAVVARARDLLPPGTGTVGEVRASRSCYAARLRRAGGS